MLKVRSCRAVEMRGLYSHAKVAGIVRWSKSMLDVQRGHNTTVGIGVNSTHRHGAAEIGGHAHAFKAIHLVALSSRGGEDDGRRSGEKDSNNIGTAERTGASFWIGDCLGR